MKLIVVSTRKRWVSVKCGADEKAVNRLRELQVRPDDFDRIKLIGKGAYGAVQLVSDRQSLSLSVCVCVKLIYHLMEAKMAL